MAIAPPKPEPPSPPRRERRLAASPARPRPLRRGRIWVCIAGIVCGVTGAAVLVGIRVGVPPNFGFQVQALMIALILPVLVVHHARATSALRRAAAADHLLCPECTYDLRTLDQAGTCPECGRPYAHDAVRTQWLDAQRRLKRTPRA